MIHDGAWAHGGWPATADDTTPEVLARERALRAAVLIDAIRCVLGTSGGRERRSWQAATRWIMSRDTRSPFSFHNVCDSLGLDPSRIRRLLIPPPGAVVRLPIAGELLHPVRRPRRQPVRYVALRGGRRS